MRSSLKPRIAPSNDRRGGRIPPRAELPATPATDAASGRARVAARWFDTSRVEDALLDGSLEDAIVALRARSVSALDLTELALRRIAAREPELNAFITVTADAARERAKKSDAQGPLAGAPIALKDLFDVAGVPTSGGSKLLAANLPTEDSTVAPLLFDA